jgi:lysine/ornithine N-monooxygenase
VLNGNQNVAAEIRERVLACAKEHNYQCNALAKGLQYYPSDNRKFKFHVTVCACRYLAGLGYYIPHLRTKKDTVLREENAAYIARSIARFLPAYLDGGTEE